MNIGQFFMILLFHVTIHKLNVIKIKLIIISSYFVSVYEGIVSIFQKNIIYLKCTNDQLLI